MDCLSSPMSSTIDTVVVLTFPMLTLGCRLAEDIMTFKFSVPSFSLSMIIAISNTTRVTPAGTVILNGPE